MDAIKQFSLADFLAYFFPGLFSFLGLYMLMILTPISTRTPTSTVGIITFIVLSYILGIILSGFSDLVTFQKNRASRDKIPIKDFEDEICKACSEIFNVNKKWTTPHFYMCRSLVLEKMPHISQKIERQSSLRQLRRNLLFPILIWIGTGMVYGISFLINGQRPWGIATCIFSIVIGSLVFKAMRDRMLKNEEREVRETLTAFLIGYQTGIFKAQ